VADGEQVIAFLMEERNQTLAQLYEEINKMNEKKTAKIAEAVKIETTKGD
jgi:hypothetical protein